MPLLIGRGKSLSALDEALKRENLIVLVSQREDDKEDISPEDLYEVGTVSLIKQTFKLPDNSVKCVVEGMFRVRIRDCPQTEPHFTAKIEILEDVEEVDREELEKIRLTIQAQIENFLHLGIPFPADNKIRGSHSNARKRSYQGFLKRIEDKERYNHRRQNGTTFQILRH
ncbi:LON peptidase substrate-binding domain-containing protein [Candidatus Hakubella thermalkaliphila]|uniref:LON peptidase substrate-binding domain-containing protein n=1 Tax=Candidatus Hakubella thermalkaliphila TaxID=2754717 RepID=UPI0034DB36E3